MGEDRNIFINLDANSVEFSLVQAVVDSLNHKEKTSFLMHQLVLNVQNSYPNPNALIQECCKSKMGIRLLMPPEFAKIIINLAKTQNSVGVEEMATLLLMHFVILGMQTFSATIGENLSFLEMHKAVAERLEGVLDVDSDIQGKEG